MAREFDDAGTADRVAIIGMACRFPGASGINEFWENLQRGVESISAFTEEEVLAAGVDPATARSPHYVKSRGIIGGADLFDASFFGFTPREAELLDPQHRVFLECCWHALEDGGYDPQTTRARVGVYGGVGTNWHLGDARHHPEVVKNSSGASVVTSNDKDYLTTRVSYKLNLTGPSVNVQCACSTSLVAAVMGFNSLLSYQCDLVLAGGVTVEIPEKKGYLFQEGGMESPDGHCRPFDRGASGTVFSRGAGVVLLKRLEDALRDGDHVYAVIRGGAVNNDGAHKVGFTAPSVRGQVEVAVEALEMAGVSADTLSFVEAHGTATPLGDPIEVASLTESFRNYTARREFCALGSVKGNIGHTDVASGAAGLIKAALALKHGRLPASLNFESPNPKIDFESSPFFVNTSLRELPRDATPLRALVNSFGVGGTNACVILEEPPPPPTVARTRAESRRRQLILLSARTDAALDALTERLRAHVERNGDLDLGDLAYTCQVGRRHFSRRRFLTCEGRSELLEKLGAGPRPGVTDVVCEGEGRAVVFAFPGQGNQYVGMGRGLYRAERVFREAVDECCELLKGELGLDLREVIFAEGEAAHEAAALLNQTYVTQPSLFVISYAQARLWMSWGVRPDALVGHSVGEYVAACLAGVFSLEDALRCVARRGRLIQDLPGGSMLAVLVSEDKVAPFLTPALEVAAVNSPQLTVVAGPTEEIARLEARLAAEKIFHKRLDTSHAFHSAMMEPALPAFAEFVATLALSEPSIPIASTVTGRWLTAAEATDHGYWVRHVRRAVRLSDALKTILAGEGAYVFLETGPGHSLESAVKYHLEAKSPHAVVGSMRAPTDAGSDEEYLLGAVGRLWAAGRAAAWAELHGDAEPRRVSLPGYPFERQKFALDFTKNRTATASAPADAPKKPDVGDWFYLPSWRRTPPPQVLRARQAAAAAEQAGCWLVFEDGEGVGERVARLVEGRGAEVVRVREGEEFARDASGAYIVRPGAKEDYERLVGELKAAGRRPSRVLHLWNLGGGEGLPSLEEIGRAEALGFYSPLFVEQAFIRQNVLEDLRIVVAADGAFDVAGEGVRKPAKALALGPCRVIGKEFPVVRSRFVDVTLPRDEKELASLAERLVEETLLEADDTVAAYRNGYRWAEWYDPVYLERNDEGLRSQLRDGGTYLITGGLGGLGLLVARAAAQAARVNLVLTHRSFMPEREEWRRWLDEHTDDDSVSEKIRAVLELEESGAAVWLARADTTDPAAMLAVRRGVEEMFGAVNGVIHSAGMPGGGIISLKSEEMAAEVLAPKVMGTLVLDSVFRDAGLDFLILFSSITSVLGEAGRVDYCSANCFMDAYAHYRQREAPGAVRSLNWAAWGEIGMAADWEEAKAKRSGARAASAREGGPAVRLIGKEAGQEVYEVLLDPERDWVVNSHLVFGIPTLVGAAFLDLVRQLAEIKSPGDTPVLENMYFISPLMFEQGREKRLRLFVRDAGGRYKFAFRSQPVEKDEGRDIWHDHFTGELLKGGGPARRRLDLGSLAERLGGAVDYSPFHVADESAETPLLEFGERWETLEEVRLGEREWLAKLRLGEGFVGDLREFAFHPALTDVAIAAAINHVTREPYLPYGYKRIELKAPYTPNLWSHIRLNGDYQPGGETVSFDVTVTNPDGDELLTVERYTLKKVNAVPPHAGRRAQPSNGRGAADANGGGNGNGHVGGNGHASGNGHEPAAGRARKRPSRPKDILPEEGLDALRRLLGAPFVTQVVVATSDLHALIEEAKPSAKKAEGEESAGDAARKTPAYSRPALPTPYEEPANEVERAVVDVWRGILGIDQIGVNDDFTALGGNSLLAVQTVANIADAFQVDLPIESFYKRPTARGVAETVLELLVSMAGADTLDDLLSALEE